MREIELLELIAARTESLPHLVSRVDELTDEVRALDAQAHALEVRVDRTEVRCDERSERYTRRRQDSGQVRVARITARQAVFGAILGALAIIAVALITAMAT